MYSGPYSIPCLLPGYQRASLQSCDVNSPPESEKCKNKSYFCHEDFGVSLQRAPPCCLFLELGLDICSGFLPCCCQTAYLTLALVTLPVNPDSLVIHLSVLRAPAKSLRKLLLWAPADFSQDVCSAVMSNSSLGLHSQIPSPVLSPTRLCSSSSLELFPVLMCVGRGWCERLPPTSAGAL